VQQGCSEVKEKQLEKAKQNKKEENPRKKK